MQIKNVYAVSESGKKVVIGQYTLIETPSSLSVSGNFTNTQTYGEPVDITGLSFTVTYTSGRSNTISPASISISPSTWQGSGTQTATFTYTENNVSVNVSKSASVIAPKIVTFPSNTNYMAVSSSISDYVTFKINGGSSISSADFIQNYIGQSVTGIETIEIISSQDPTTTYTSYYFSSDVPITYSGLTWYDPLNGYNKQPFGPTTTTSTNVQFSYINITINQSTSFSRFIVDEYSGPI